MAINGVSINPAAESRMHKLLRVVFLNELRSETAIPLVEQEWKGKQSLMNNYHALWEGLFAYYGLRESNKHETPLVNRKWNGNDGGYKMQASTSDHRRAEMFGMSLNTLRWLAYDPDSWLND